MRYWLARVSSAALGFVLTLSVFFGILWFTRTTVVVTLPEVTRLRTPKQNVSSTQEPAKSQQKPLQPNVSKPQQHPARVEKEDVDTRMPVSLRSLLDDDYDLALSSSLAKTGEASLLGKALNDGLFLAINRMNASSGGIGGAIGISLDARDDESRMKVAQRHVGELIEHSPLFFSPLSDSLLPKVLLPRLRRSEIACLFPVTGVRPTPHPENVVYWRSSYHDEVRALSDYTINTIKKRRVALFFEDSAWGRSAAKSLEDALASYDVSLVEKGSYQSGTVNVMPALKKIVRAEPQVVVCIASGRPAYNFIREAVNQKLHYVTYLGISRLAGIQQHLRAARGVTLVTSSVVPNPSRSMMPLVKEYRADMKKYLPNKDVTTYGLEGYIHARILEYLILRMPPSATVGTLLSYAQSLRDADVGGLTLSYKNGGLSQSVWINTGPHEEWQEYVVKGK